MLDFFRDALSGAELLDYLEHLPRTSAYVATLADDEELAEAQPPPKSSGPSLTEWSAEVEMLARAVDRLGEVVTAVTNLMAKRPRNPPAPMRRPITAHDRVTARRRRATHQRIKAMVAPRPGRRTMADPPEGDAAATHTLTPGPRRRRPDRPD